MNRIFKVLRGFHDAVRTELAIRRGSLVPFSHRGHQYFLNPEPASRYHIKDSIEKIANLVDLIDKDTRVLFDVGANCGLFAAFAARQIPGCLVHCFEPSPDLIPVIEKNTAGENVVIHNLAVGDSNGRFRLFVNPASQQTNSLERNSVSLFCGEDEIRALDVDCVTLDAFAEQRSVQAIDVLKVDVQGFEGAVFRGGAAFCRT